MAICDDMNLTMNDKMDYGNYKKLDGSSNCDIKLNDDYMGIISEEDWSNFKKELDLYVSKLGFGETYVSFMKDAVICERVFYIKSPVDKSFDELMFYLEDIISHMKSFCKNNKLKSLFMDSYIVFD
ncbi:MAG: hypothetical protein Q4P14_06275 [Methanobacteriaceae archaeon]|nr:hypothetical protein [Methanobacteriaceae archaeon]